MIGYKEIWTNLWYIITGPNIFLEKINGREPWNSLTLNKNRIILKSHRFKVLFIFLFLIHKMSAKIGIEASICIFDIFDVFKNKFIIIYNIKTVHFFLKGAKLRKNNFTKLCFDGSFLDFEKLF
jgi:hypothetical protein